MLHCDVLKLPRYIGWRYGWCGMPGIGMRSAYVLRARTKAHTVVIKSTYFREHTVHVLQQPLFASIALFMHSITKTFQKC